MLCSLSARIFTGFTKPFPPSSSISKLTKLASGAKYSLFQSVSTLSGCVMKYKLSARIFPHYFLQFWYRQKLFFSWLPMRNLIWPKSETVAVVQRQFLFLCGKIHIQNPRWQKRRLLHNMFSNSFSCMTEYMCKILQPTTTKTTFWNRCKLPHRK